MAMEQGIYVDVLLAVNFLVDYLLLVTTQLLCRRSVQRKRIVPAALLGAISTLGIFLPQASALMQGLGKGLLAGLMMLLADRWQGWRRFLAGWGMFFAVSFLFGGAMLALRMTIGEGWMLCANGVVYFHIPPLVLVGNIALGFGLVQLYERLFAEKQPKKLFCDVELQLLGEKLCCRALLDSGNQLKEPFSGWPVVLLERGLFPGKIPPERLRMIPCKSIGGSKLLKGAKGDVLRLLDGEALQAEQFYVALSDEPISDGSYQLLLNPRLLGSKQ